MRNLEILDRLRILAKMNLSTDDLNNTFLSKIKQSARLALHIVVGQHAGIKENMEMG